MQKSMPGVGVTILLYIITIFTIYYSGAVSSETIHWKYMFLFPVGVLVAIISISSGISWSNFWVPINVIVLNIEPRICCWLALLTTLFGFGSGVIKHHNQNSINFRLVRRYLYVAIPGAIIGTLNWPQNTTIDVKRKIGEIRKELTHMRKLLYDHKRSIHIY